MTDEELETARTRLIAQPLAEDQQGLSFRDSGPEQQIVEEKGDMRKDAFTQSSGGGNQRLWMLANKGACFRDMLAHHLVDELVGHVLGSEFILSALSANIAKPGGARMRLCTDPWWMPQPSKPDSNYQRASEITRRPRVNFIDPDPRLGIAPPVVCNTMCMLSDFTPDNGATEFVPTTTRR